MKKLLAILTMLAVLLTAVAFAEAADVIGEWYLVDMVMGETSINPAAMGMNMTLVLNEDGTMTATNSYGDTEPETAEGTWELSDGNLVIALDDTPDTVLIQDGQLKMEMGEEGYFVFGREPVTAPELPVAVPAENEDAFLGTWKMSQINMGGMVMPAAAMGAETIMTVEAGKAVIGSEDSNDEYATAFADGVLTLTSAEEGSDPMTVELNNDGSISISVSMGEELSMVMYFEKAE